MTGTTRGNHCFMLAVLDAIQVWEWEDDNMVGLLWQIIDEDGYGKALISDKNELRYYRMIKYVPILHNRRVVKNVWNNETNDTKGGYTCI